MSEHQSTLTQSANIVSAIWHHPANHGRRLRAVLQSLGWQVSKRTLHFPRVIDFHGKKLKCFPDSTSTSAALYFNGLADYWEMKFMLAYLRPGDNFLDVGANAGVYSILAAACVGDSGSIDAFEPMEDMARRIEEQAALNSLGNVHVHRVVVGNQNATVQFGFSANDAMRHVQRPNEKSHDGIPIQSLRLDEFKPEKHYALGKMDIEGAEPLALEGCADRLDRSNPPVWLLELAGYSTLYGKTTDEVIALLDAAGYTTAIYDPGHRQVVYTNKPWVHGVQNVLAIARTHRGHVEERVAGVGGG